MGRFCRSGNLTDKGYRGILTGMKKGHGELPGQIRIDQLDDIQREEAERLRVRQGEASMAAFLAQERAETQEFEDNGVAYNSRAEASEAYMRGEISDHMWGLYRNYFDGMDQWERESKAAENDFYDNLVPKSSDIDVAAEKAENLERVAEITGSIQRLAGWFRSDPDAVRRRFEDKDDRQGFDGRNAEEIAWDVYQKEVERRKEARLRLFGAACSRCAFYELCRVEGYDEEELVQDLIGDEDAKVRQKKMRNFRKHMEDIMERRRGDIQCREAASGDSVTQTRKDGKWVPPS